MTSIDLKNAYFLVLIYASLKKYWSFSFLNSIFEFQCLVFCLCSVSISPYIFTKIMRSVVSYLRKSGIIFAIYLDDRIVLSKSYYDSKKDIQFVVDDLESLGFVINRKRSHFIFSKRC